MRRPREAVDAAMLAAPVGIDRAVEADIGRLVAGDDAPRRHLLHVGGKRFELAERFPTVVDGLIGDRLEAAAAVGLGAPAMAAARGNASRLMRKALGIGRFSQRDGHVRHIGLQEEQIKNIICSQMRTIAEPRSRAYRFRAMISVIIPTLNARAHAGACARGSRAGRGRRHRAGGNPGRRRLDRRDLRHRRSRRHASDRGAAWAWLSARGRRPPRQRRLAALSACRHGARAGLGRGGAKLHRAGRERQTSPGCGVVQLRARR